MKEMSSMRRSGFEARAAIQGILVAAMVVGFAGWMSQAQAQLPAPTTVKAKLVKVTPFMEKTPEYGASTSERKKVPRLREWLEVEVEFETQSDSKVGVIPELMMTFYVAVKGATAQVLTGSFTYANIQDNEKNFAVVYVSPHSLTRIMGEPNKFKLGDVAKVGVEILYQGRVVAETPEAKALQASSAAKVTDVLLPKEKTPFNMLWIDRYVELKPDRQ